MKAFWDERYKDQEYAYGTQPNEFFKYQLGQQNPGTLLLPCEGEGRNAVYAAKLGWDVTAIDYSEEGKNKALALAEKEGVSIRYLVGDIQEVELDCQFDVVACIFCHFPPMFRQIINHRLVSYLREGGMLITEVFSKEQLQLSSGGPQTEEMLYSEQMLREDFSGLREFHTRQLHRLLSEGKYHQGKASVLQGIGTK